MADNILEIKNLTFSFRTYGGVVKSVRDVSFDVREGEILGIVGESGCGKSVTSQCILRLNPEPPGFFEGGSILYKGEDIVKKSDKEMRKIRGTEISFIFQDPMTCLNPTMKVGRQITEAIKHHQKLSKEEAEKRSIEMLKLVQIPNPEERAQQYPHEFSGGMRQRAMIAMALSCNPKLLIADEPTTALDVTIQAQIIDLLGDIRKKTGTAIILITHDLGVVASLVDRVAVMYAGKIVETAKVNDIFKNAAHPYTKALLSSLPSHDTSKEDKLTSIPGTPPDLIKPPVGCGFASRCEKCMKICKAKQPPVFDLGDGHSASCWLLHKDCPQGGNK